MERGNCFSLCNKNGDDYKIVNFGLENLEHLLHIGVLSYPVKVLPLSEGVALMLDERIPKSYYQQTFCSICCPFDLLPTNQKHEEYRKQLTKEVIMVEVDGLILEKMNFKDAEYGPNKLKDKWEARLQSDANDADAAAIFSCFSPVIIDGNTTNTHET